MTPDRISRLRRRLTTILPVIFLAVPFLHGQALAAGESSSEIAAQGDEFSRQKADLLNRLKDLKVKIEEAGKTISDKADAPEQARRTIDDMRAVLSPLLAAVADNGEVGQLGVKALKNAIDRKASLERDQRFTPEDRQRLVDAWAKRVKSTGEAVAELQKARTTLLKAMITLQTKEDLMAEWAALQSQDEVVAIVKQLAQSFNETSANIQNFIALLEAPPS
jgi:hypothetical protein